MMPGIMFQPPPISSPAPPMLGEKQSSINHSGVPSNHPMTGYPFPFFPSPFYGHPPPEHEHANNKNEKIKRSDNKEVQ